MHILKLDKSLLVLALGATIFSACGDTDTTSNDTAQTVSSESAFPVGLDLVLPLDTDAISGDTEVATAIQTGFTDQINVLLNGTTPSICTFTPELFYELDNDASCFGPDVAYEGHPDYITTSSVPEDGTLPGGDVGMWQENDDTGTPCAIGQLHSRINGSRSQTRAALMGLASMICVANAEGESLPSEDTLDLTSGMNDLGIANVYFTNAALANTTVSGDSVFSYELDFTYAVSGVTHQVVVNMEHTPGTDSTRYSGRLDYRVDDEFLGGNCPDPDVTRNGSFVYDVQSESEAETEHRSAQFCGHGVDGLNASGVVNPAFKHTASTPSGWGDDFSIFTANYDPSSLDGNYSYSWQAGPGDGHTRVFNANVDIPEDDSTDATAKAFYGYGPDVTEVDGNIDGFICNWAGPGSDSTVLDYVQYQDIEYTPVSRVFNVVGSNIDYAPTNNCNYDGSGTFSYDTDNDGVVDTDPATSITNDLLSVVDADGNDIFDEIESSGFVAPTTPAP